MFQGSDRRELARYLALSQVGLEMVAPVAVGATLDHYLDWSPWGVIVGAVLGMTAGLVHVVQLTRKDPPKQTPPHPPEPG